MADYLTKAAKNLEWLNEAAKRCQQLIEEGDKLTFGVELGIPLGNDEKSVEKAKEMQAALNEFEKASKQELGPDSRTGIREKYKLLEQSLEKLKKFTEG